MVPNEKELISFIENRNLVNYSIIAKHYGINNATVSDLINDLVKKKLVTVNQIGGSKIVQVK